MGKPGIWMSIFPDKQTQEPCPKVYMILHGETFQILKGGGDLVME